jgi:hypothetical protein
MPPESGDVLSIMTMGWLVTGAAGDVAAPGQAVFRLSDVGVDSATFLLTVPDDVDYDHAALSLTEEGAAATTITTPFTGRLTDLTAGTWYIAVVSAFDGSDEDTANRSVPSPAVRFRTAGSAAGGYSAVAGTGGQLSIEFFTDEATTAEAVQYADILQDRARMPLGIRGIYGEVELVLIEVDQSFQLLGLEIDAELMERRRE